MSWVTVLSLICQSDTAWKFHYNIVGSKNGAMYMGRTFEPSCIFITPFTCCSDIWFWICDPRTRRYQVISTSTSAFCILLLKYIMYQSTYMYRCRYALLRQQMFRISIETRKVVLSFYLSEGIPGTLYPNHHMVPIISNISQKRK